MKYSYFVVDNNHITNLYEKEYKNNFMSEDHKWKSWEEVGDDEKNPGTTRGLIL